MLPESVDRNKPTSPWPISVVGFVHSRVSVKDADVDLVGRVSILLLWHLLRFRRRICREGDLLSGGPPTHQDADRKTEPNTLSVTRVSSNVGRRRSLTSYSTPHAGSFSSSLSLGSSKAGEVFCSPRFIRTEEGSS